MSKGRLEAFSDGVFAIIITIMVLELKVPHGDDVAALRPLLPVFLSYVLSFVFVGIYWNNHHHLFQAVKQVGGWVLWANSNLLFWLSLTPFVTAWMGENHFAPWPVALYGLVQIAASVAYFLLTRALLSVNRQNPLLAEAVGRDMKGKVSTALLVVGSPLAFVSTWIALAAYIAVLATWFVPDRRIESRLTAAEKETSSAS